MDALEAFWGAVNDLWISIYSLLSGKWSNIFEIILTRWFASEYLFWSYKQETQKSYCKQIYNLLPV